MKRIRLLGRLAAWIAMAGLAAHSAAEASVYVPANRLWTGGVVPFEWHPDISIANRLRVVIAMNIWLEVANVEFVVRTDETDYVLIQNAPGDSGSRSAEVGRNGGKQDLFIRQDLSGVTDYGLAHELGHVLGYYHTQQRPDRDTYLTWYEGRTSDSGKGNFAIESNALAYPRAAMDYDSVMSYGRCTFSLCGDECQSDLDSCRVLEINDPEDAAEFDALMGQRSYLTRVDALTMSFLYPPSGWRFVETGYDGNIESGTFHDPYLTVDKAVLSAPNNAIVWVQPGHYELGSGVVTKAMTLRAPLGGVTITLQ
jgi:hypothetical protein